MVPAMMEVLAPLMLQTPSGFNSHPLTFARSALLSHRFSPAAMAETACEGRSS